MSRGTTSPRPRRTQSSKLTRPCLEPLESRQLLATFSVRTTVDSGVGSLRQAIQDADASSGVDTIRFQVGTGARTINLASPLPQITEGLIIDGTSQAGYAGKPLIELNGASAGAGANGLLVGGSDVIIKGLVINRFDGNGIRIVSGGNATITGNYIGTNAAGTAALGNGGDGILLQNSAGDTVGGTTAADRNVISGNKGVGLRILGAEARNNVVFGNYIGTNAAGTAAVPNGVNPNPMVKGDGISLEGASLNFIGGSDPGSANVISGNAGIGLRITGAGATGNIIQNNRIGVAADGFTALGNNSSGVFVANGATNNRIGGEDDRAGNTIAFNNGAGVLTQDASNTGTAILSNRIYANAFLGIDLDTDGLTRRNLPTLISAVRLGQQTLVQGTLTAAPNATFRVQFFASVVPDANLYGEGQGLLGETRVTTNSAGVANIRFLTNRLLPPGFWVTATATDAANTTSEFSLGVSYRTRNDSDFDGDGRSDPAVYRFSTGGWQVLNSTAGLQTFAFGQANLDTPLVADWDVDGRADPAVYHPGLSQVLIRGTRSGQYGFSYGAPTDIPVPADYDGDGKIDAAVYRPSTAEWIIQGSRTGDYSLSRTFGAPNLDLPVPMDIDGDGAVDIAVYRPTTAEWFFQGSRIGFQTITFGLGGVDIPVPLDIDGDGTTDIAVYRPGSAEWFVRGSRIGFQSLAFGLGGSDLAIPADYDGDGTTDIAVYRPSTSEWFLRQSSAGFAAKTVGTPGLDLPAYAPLVYRLRGPILPYLASSPFRPAAATSTASALAATAQTASAASIVPLIDATPAPGKSKPDSLFASRSGWLS